MDLGSITQIDTRAIIVPNNKWYERSLASYVATIAIIPFIYLAFQNFKAERRYVNVVYLADNLSRGIPVSGQVAHEFVGEALSLVDAGECRSDLLDAALTVVLNDLDASTAMAPGDTDIDSLNVADHFLRHVLSCTPTDGDAWARLAMIRRGLGAQPSELAALLERSSWYAPSEGTTLRARLELWRTAPDDLLLGAESALDHDILTVLTYFPFKASASVLAGGTQRFRDRVIAVSASLPVERVANLRKAGLTILPLRGTEGKVDSAYQPQVDLPR